MIIKNIKRIYSHNKMLSCIIAMQKETRSMIQDKKYEDAKELNKITIDLFNFIERFYHDN